MRRGKKKKNQFTFTNFLFLERSFRQQIAKLFNQICAVGPSGLANHQELYLTRGAFLSVYPPYSSPLIHAVHSHLTYCFSSTPCCFLCPQPPSLHLRKKKIYLSFKTQFQPGFLCEAWRKPQGPDPSSGRIPKRPECVCLPLQCAGCFKLLTKYHLCLCHPCLHHFRLIVGR